MAKQTFRVRPLTSGRYTIVGPGGHVGSYVSKTEAAQVAADLNRRAK